jgi:hypothetical protein
VTVRKVLAVTTALGVEGVEWGGSVVRGGICNFSESKCLLQNILQGVAQATGAGGVKRTEKEKGHSAKEHLFSCPQKALPSDLKLLTLEQDKVHNCIENIASFIYFPGPPLKNSKASLSELL